VPPPFIRDNGFVRVSRGSAFLVAFRNIRIR
jgi:hypothetical protein